MEMEMFVNFLGEPSLTWLLAMLCEKNYFSNSGIISNKTFAMLTAITVIHVTNPACLTGDNLNSKTMSRVASVDNVVLNVPWQHM